VREKATGRGIAGPGDAILVLVDELVRPGWGLEKESWFPRGLLLDGIAQELATPRGVITTPRSGQLQSCIDYINELLCAVLFSCS
jgi:hypothetical protein